MSSAIEVVDHLRKPETIRSHCQKLYQLSEAGEGAFTIHPELLDDTAKFVIEVTESRYPFWDVPLHCRWNHFNVGAVKRGDDLSLLLQDVSSIERAKAIFDVIFISVLLDAGAGMSWQYVDPVYDKVFTRSEGLAFASLDLFTSGALSSLHDNPYRVDYVALCNLSLETLEKFFQVSERNPLVGLEGRLSLMHRLGKALERHELTRPSDIMRIGEKAIPVRMLFSDVLKLCSDVWPSRLTWEGISLGDVWHHPALGDVSDPESYVPFHKLSQWLTYSLIYPYAMMGTEVEGLDDLTGLPEYRNGGLLLDMGLISLPEEVGRAFPPEHPVIVEWRAVTVVLLDRLADHIRAIKGLNQQVCPLGKILEGGTWQAGRKIAQERRSDGGPPISLISDGTVF